MHGMPNWRATTAACEVAPPSLVSTPLAAIIPWTSSGLVNGRTMMTSCLLSFAIFSARSASKYACPTAAPGEAFTPFANSVPDSQRLLLRLIVEVRVQQGIHLLRCNARSRLLLW